MSSHAFEAFYRENYNFILRFTERRIDSERALDVTAECFAIAWKKFDPAEPFPLPWLYQTARHLIGNAYRKRRRDEELLHRLTAEARSSGNEDSIDLSDALSKLTPKDREVLELTYWEELSAAEVGIVVGCSEAAAWKRISRAKESLRQVLSTQRAPRKEAADV